MKNKIYSACIRNLLLPVWLSGSWIIVSFHQWGSLNARLVHKSDSRRTMKRAVALTKKKRENDCVESHLPPQKKESAVCRWCCRLHVRCPHVPTDKTQEFSPFVVLFFLLDDARSFYRRCWNAASTARASGSPSPFAHRHHHHSAGRERERERERDQ